MPFNHGWRLKYGHMLLTHFGFIDTQQNYGGCNIFQSAKKKKWFISVAPALVVMNTIMTAFASTDFHSLKVCWGDTDKGAPSEWNDNSVKYRSMDQTGYVKSFNSGSSRSCLGMWEATADHILTMDICNTPENLNMFQFVRRRSEEQKIGL